MEVFVTLVNAAVLLKLQVSLINRIEQINRRKTAARIVGVAPLAVAIVVAVIATRVTRGIEAASSPVLIAAGLYATLVLLGHAATWLVIRLRSGHGVREKSTASGEP